MTRMTFTIKGIVQGVGFRPFVLRQARAHKLSGSVANTSNGVTIIVEGERDACLSFIDSITNSPPAGAMIFSIESIEEAARGEKGFIILPSSGGAAEAAVSPDLGICADCERELLDKADRRYLYPFLNCTACGPRFTILSHVPYDRANTAMAKFPMCNPCNLEYNDPENRRFHAQPTACRDCGPNLTWFENGQALHGDEIARFAPAIREGKTIAVRGLGGYHLACDAGSESAVMRLRELKHRYAKPLAIMVRDINEAKRLCYVSPSEEKELTSPRKPIVLLKKREDASPAIANAVAPESGYLGVMLPYTPLHVLLMRDVPPIVLTSANISSAPMPYKDEDVDRVARLSDAVLTHNRPILRRMDDSVLTFTAGRRRLIRRARGFVPEPIPLEGASEHILAFGAQLKNTFCLAKDSRAYLSGHMGDLDDGETFEFYVNELGSFLSLFGGTPKVFACDLHPDYASSKVAREWASTTPGARLIEVEHHHAHFASVLAEHRLPFAQGFIWDGSGYGSDGTLWGGEEFLGSARRFERTARLRPISLIGGDTAVREPWRIGLAAVAEAVGEAEALSLFNKKETPLLLTARKSEALSPKSSGMGRLFDAVASIAGLHPVADYEGQAAIALEQAYCDSADGAYEFSTAINPQGLTEWDWRPVIRDAVRDIPLGAGVISARFHRALIALIVSAAKADAPVALSGGVFQNKRLLAGCISALESKGIAVYSNELVPANDGGISFGQAAVAASLLKEF